MASPTGTPPPRPDDKSLGELVFEVSERTSSLIRVEIELAKAEVREKVDKLIRGSGAGGIATQYRSAGRSRRARSTGGRWRRAR